MYPLGHYGMALLFAAPAALVLGRRRSALLTLFALCVAMLPDMDTPLPLTHHHGGMHTLLFAAVGGITAGIIFTAMAGGYRVLFRGDDRFYTNFREWTVFQLSTTGFFVGIVSHLVADAIAIPTGENLLRPFWPLSDVVVELWLVPPGDPVWNFGLFAAGLAVQSMLLSRRSSLEKRTNREPTRD